MDDITGFGREKAERDAATNSYMDLWDSQNPHSRPDIRSHVACAFAIGHMSAHQDLSNRAAR